MAKGFFITLEGGEGAGKSTLQQGMAARLRAAGLEVVVTREPGGTELGKRLRQELLNGGHVEPVAELLLYAADRAQHVAQIIAPAVRRGAVVICDRFSDSTVAYQGYGRQLDKKQIAALNKLAQQGLAPHLTLWLDIPVKDGLARTQRRGAADRLEAEALAFHERVRKGFRALAKAEPRRIARLDARQPAEAVLAEALRLTARRLKVKHADL